MSSLTAKLSSPRFQQRVLWISVAVLVVGVLAFVGTRFTNTAESTQAPLNTNVPAKDVSKNPKTIKLDPAARQVAKKFILTAVARENLKQAYALAGPQIRQGQSLKSWMTGNIAVVPYPVSDLDFAPMKIDYSYPKEAMIEVALLPKQGTKAKGQLFAMTLNKIHGKWVVNSWVPKSTPPVPCSASSC
ncbi:MAG TPA: hypothetical protein VLN26_02885 [Gaiellaceae bacterium]|nr:hypothetical protein [Gaiellaceae bacterium]